MKNKYEKLRKEAAILLTASTIIIAAGCGADVKNENNDTSTIVASESDIDIKDGDKGRTLVIIQGNTATIYDYKSFYHAESYYRIVLNSDKTIYVPINCSYLFEGINAHRDAEEFVTNLEYNIVCKTNPEHNKVNTLTK